MITIALVLGLAPKPGWDNLDAPLKHVFKKDVTGNQFQPLKYGTGWANSNVVRFSGTSLLQTAYMSYKINCSSSISGSAFPSDPCGMACKLALQPIGAECDSASITGGTTGTGLQTCHSPADGSSKAGQCSIDTHTNNEGYACVFFDAAHSGSSQCADTYSPSDHSSCDFPAKSPLARLLDKSISQAGPGDEVISNGHSITNASADVTNAINLQCLQPPFVYTAVATEGSAQGPWATPATPDPLSIAYNEIIEYPAAGLCSEYTEGDALNKCLATARAAAKMQASTPVNNPLSSLGVAGPDRYLCGYEAAGRQKLGLATRDLTCTAAMEVDVPLRASPPPDLATTNDRKLTTTDCNVIPSSSGSGGNAYSMVSAGPVGKECSVGQALSVPPLSTLLLESTPEHCTRLATCCRGCFLTRRMCVFGVSTAGVGSRQRRSGQRIEELERCP